MTDTSIAVYIIIGWIVFWTFVAGTIALSIYMSWWTLIGRKVSFTKQVNICGTQFLFFITEEKKHQWILTMWNVKARRRVYSKTYRSRREAQKKQNQILEAIVRYYKNHQP